MRVISDSIITHTSEPLDQIGGRIDNAYDLTQRGRQDWIEGTLKLASALREARDQFPSNAAFSARLTETGRDRIGHNDRAALISMASADTIEVTRIVLAETQRFSWRQVSDEEIKPRLPRLTHAGKTTEMQQVAKVPQRETPSEQITTPLLSDAVPSHEGKTAKVVELPETPQEAALSRSPPQTATPLPSKTSAPGAEKRDDNYIVAVGKFIDETIAARARVDEFSRANYVAALIGKIKEELEEMEEKLTARLKRADAP